MWELESPSRRPHSFSSFPPKNITNSYRRNTAVFVRVLGGRDGLSHSGKIVEGEQMTGVLHRQLPVGLVAGGPSSAPRLPRSGQLLPQIRKGVKSCRMLAATPAAFLSSLNERFTIEGLVLVSEPLNASIRMLPLDIRVPGCMEEKCYRINNFSLMR